MEETKEKEIPRLEPEMVEIIIPLCCKEGWDTCTHVVGKQKKVKQNIGL